MKTTAVSYTVSTARYAKGMLLVQCTKDGPFKTRAMRLIGDGLKARWTHRENGYIASPAKVAKFERLFGEGFDASAISGQLEPPDAATDEGG